MGHKLDLILQALCGLQEAAIRGDVQRPRFGVCGNLASLARPVDDVYTFVHENAADWPHAMYWGDDEGVPDLAGTLKDCFVPDVEGVGLWEGANLDLRLDLIEFLIEKCEAGLTR